jgi:pyruvate,water dikinase
MTFAAPAPGCWELETTHHGLRPLTPFVRDAYKRAFEAGTTVLAERWGLPLARVRAELVHGCFYVRPEGLGEGAEPKPPPPMLLMKLVVRLHPGMRRRTRTAARAWAERRWRAEVDRWFEQDRATLVERNLDLQRVDLAGLDDAVLATHVLELLDHFETNARRNLETHGGDLMPVGDLLAHGDRWGIGAAELADLLRGSSPATVETAQLLRPVASAVALASHRPSSVEEVRALGADVRDAVDAWLERHSWRLVTSDDVDRPTLAELPGLQLGALLSAADHDRDASPPPDLSSVRSRVPVDERELFAELVAEARYGNRQREDIRGVCWNWPGGLLRRGLLEAGRRLVAAGRLHDPDHVVELFPTELEGLLATSSGPSADEVAARASERDAVEAAHPPRTLGPPEEPPPLAALPRPMARATAAMMANLGADATPPQSRALAGVGIGDAPYRGRACVVRDAVDALTGLEPGDVLITTFTGPSFNSLIPILGALVVEEGGALCHAAIVAREFGLPAVIGVQGATSELVHGSMVEVDPAAGVVRAV